MSDTFLAWATDPELRRNGSSGGFVRAMLIWMLETNVVDRVLYARVGPREGGFHPAQLTTDDPDELRDRRTASVYAPLDITSVLWDYSLTYASVVKPCNLSAFAPHSKLTIELLCRHTPTLRWTQNVAERMGIENPQSVVYRGDGWPGNVTIDGKSMPILKSGMTPKWAMPTCKTCKRTTGDSDIAVADPWGIKGDMGDGKTLVHCKTEYGLAQTQAAIAAGVIEATPLSDDVWGQRMRSHRR